MNEETEKESEVDEEGIQTAAPVLSWLLEPFVKILNFYRNIGRISDVGVILPK